MFQTIDTFYHNVFEMFYMAKGAWKRIYIFIIIVTITINSPFERINQKFRSFFFPSYKTSSLFF